MKPASYWNKRMEILEQSRYDGNVQSYHEIENIYRKQMAEMQKEINAWYARFAKNNEIDLADARKLLDAKELEELKWNVEDYIKYGTENALDPKWIKQLENASARYHISRLEALQLQIQQRAESVMAAEQDVVDERVREVYSENYYHTAFEIQRGIGIGWDLERLDERRIDNVISKPWAVDGKNFSERIWEQRDKLVNTLHQELTQSIIRGEDPERAVKTLAERMSVSQSNARRLIMTESAAMASAAQKECYKELDVEQYKIVATLDDLTCDVCAGLDGQVFKMSEYNVGTTAPPFHPNCRTVTVPYFADDADSKRAARGADGKTYLVPADTKYNEWKKAFVDGGEKPFEVLPQPEPNIEPIQFTNMNGIPIVFDKSMDQPNRLESKRILEELCGEYDTRLTMVRVATSADAKDMNDAGGDVDFSGLMRLRSTKGVTAIHEFAHSFTISDYAKKGLYDEKTEEFWKEMRKAFRDYKKDYRFDHKVSISFYSHDDVDEFMAEAFTVYKANQLGVNLTDEYNVNESSMKYVNRVGAIIDKYFKKPENQIIKPKPKELTMAQKVDSIKTEYREKYQQNETIINNLDKEIQEITQKISDKKDLTNREMQKVRDLQDEISRYKGMSGLILKDKIEDAQTKLNAINSDLERYREINDKFYNRPERKVDVEAWRKWRDWKDSLEENDPNWFNKLVDLESQQSHIEIELKKAKEDKKWYDSFDIQKKQKEFSDANQQIINIRKEINKLNALNVQKQNERKNATESFTKEVEPLIQKAGKIVFDEIKNYDKFSKTAKRIDELTAKNKLCSERYNQAKTDEERIKIYDEWVKTWDELNRVENESYVNNAKEVQRIMQDVRNWGSNGADIKGHLNNGKSKSLQLVMDGYEFYPKEWIDASLKRGNLTVKTVKRGNYDDTNKIINISGTDGEGFKTAVHELAHRMEKAFPFLRDIEQSFYDRRTQGDQLESLRNFGDKYERDEMTRKDNFIDPYMGKDYNGDSYELISMGFENAFCNPKYLEKDSEYAQWIFGILTLI